jgi:hypothetical protein
VTKSLGNQDVDMLLEGLLVLLEFVYDFDCSVNSLLNNVTYS